MKGLNYFDMKNVIYIILLLVVMLQSCNMKCNNYNEKIVNNEIWGNPQNGTMFIMSSRDGLIKDTINFIQYNLIEGAIDETTCTNNKGVRYMLTSKMFTNELDTSLLAYGWADIYFSDKSGKKYFKRNHDFKYVKDYNYSIGGNYFIGDVYSENIERIDVSSNQTTIFYLKNVGIIRYINPNNDTLNLIKRVN